MEEPLLVLDAQVAELRCCLGMQVVLLRQRYVGEARVCHGGHLGSVEDVAAVAEVEDVPL